MSTTENRKRPRVAVGGNVEIVSVSSGAPPQGRASILNCSRSGALFRLDAPRGGLFRRGKGSELAVQDSLNCVMRMPPHYQDIEILAEVVRVEQPPQDPKGLHVGVRFFLPEAPLRTDPNVAALRRVLGKAGISAEDPSLAASPTAESRRKSQRTSVRAGAKSSREARRPSRRTRRLPEMGAEATPSKRSRRVTSSGTGEIKRKRSTRSDVYSEPKRTSKREPKRSQRWENVDLSETDADELGSEVLDSASHVAEALKSDLFREESWSNYLMGASLDDEPKAKLSLDEGGQSATIRRSPKPPKAKPAPTLASVAAPAAPAPVAAAPLTTPAAPVVYTSLGGPENGLYVRGTALLKEGEARVRLPEHFSGLIDEHTLTVQVTARGACQGLYVARATGRGLIVRELAEGRSQAPFDYLVLAERRR